MDLLSAFCSDIHKFLLPGQYGDDKEGTDRLVAAGSESYSCPREQKYVVLLLYVNALP